LRASAARSFASQPGCRSRWRKPKASCSRAGNSDCKNMTLQKWSARAAIERWAARADCESVLSVTAAKSQYSAWRKSKRVLRLSVRRSRPEKGRSRRLIVSSAGTESELRFGPGIQGRGLAASPQHGEPFGASRVRSSCRHKSGKPEQRGASHDGRSAKDQL
jgi:hypothetical protein